MARAIIRFSVDGEGDNRTGHAVNTVLRDAGFDNIGTRSWEVVGPTFNDAADALRDVLDVLKKMPGGGTADHIWAYIDQTG